jgi:hypothetical protein
MLKTTDDVVTLRQYARRCAATASSYLLNDALFDGFEILDGFQNARPLNRDEHRNGWLWTDELYTLEFFLYNTWYIIPNGL